MRDANRQAFSRLLQVGTKRWPERMPFHRSLKGESCDGFPIQGKYKYINTPSRFMLLGLGQLQELPA